MKRFLSVILVLTLILSVAFSLGVSAFAVDGADIVLYACADASVNGDGSLSSPYSLLAAKNKLKEYKASGKSAIVYLMGGTYCFDDMLVFNENDMPNVTYKAYKNQVVEFSGAKAIKGFTEGEVNGVKVFTKKLDTSAENWYFKSLFSDNNRLSITRYPETGYFTVKATAPEDDLWTEENTPWEFTLGQNSFYCNMEDIPFEFKNLEDVNVRILHYWHDELAGITALDRENGKLSMSRPSSMLIRDIDRYYFENVFEALNTSGEYYVDRAEGVLYYVPFENESADSLVLYGSNIDKLIDIRNVNGISFEGVRFTRTDWVYPEADWVYEGSWHDEYNVEFPQAALFVDGVVTVEYAENVHFKNCEFINLGGTAIKLRNGVKNSSVENCYFYEIAATAIYVGGTNCLFGEKDYTQNITVKNNEIHKYGRKFFCGIGIHVTFCDTAEIVNNEIHDGYYTGISVGWIWGYAYHVTKNINVSRNLIYNIGQGWLSDMGGIYMLGKQPGTVLSENVIHNVAADPGEGGYGGWGIYLDEGSSFMSVEKNLVYSCGNQSFNTHYGEGNIIRNNIAAFSGEGLVSPGIDKGESHATGIYYNNIFITKDKAPIYIEMLTPSHFYDNGNIMWSATEGDELYFENGSDTYSLEIAQQKGFIHFPVVADPLFKDALNYDFTLAENSPAFEANFEAWDYSAAGTLKDTVIGLSKQGGQTPYNAESVDIPVTNEYGVSMVRTTLTIIGIVVCLLFLLAWTAIIVKKADKFIAIPYVSVLLLMVVFVPAFYTYVNWIEIPYYICAALIGALVTVTPVCVALVKGNSKKNIIITTIVSFVLSTGGFLGIAGIMNMILGSDEPGVVLTAMGAILIYLLVSTIRLLKHKK